MENEKNNPSISIIFIGDSKVGKTSTIYRYSEKQFLSHISTIGIDKVITHMKIKDKKNNNIDLTVKLIDTAGQEKYRKLTTSYYKYADGIILMFDVTDKETFDSISIWNNEIQNKSKKDINVLIVGNKIDLKDNRFMSKKEIEQKLSLNHFKYEEISAKDNKNIDQMIENFAKIVYYSKKNNEGGQKLQNVVNLQKKNVCCD
jgi:Ras-related protein Rab-1A